MNAGAKEGQYGVDYYREQLAAKEGMLSQTTRFLVNAQNHLLEANDTLARLNKEFHDSVSCAALIQNSLMPDENILRVFFSDAQYFVKQQIAIGGDTMFIKNSSKGVLFGLFDCTGHGVPASLMSISISLLLRELVGAMEIKQPGSVLQLLNHQFYTTFTTESYSQAQCEGLLFYYQSNSAHLKYASAKGRAFVIRNNKDIEGLQRGRNSVGNLPTQGFDTYECTFQKGDKLIAFSDGLIDQFGGEQNKKLSTSRVREFLQANADLPVPQISSHLQRLFDTWKGDNPQTDDLSFLIVEA